MKAELIPERTFIIKVGEKEVRDLRVVSRWNGLTELRTPTNQVLIVTDRYSTIAATFASVFADVFGHQAETPETSVVMGSPDLIGYLTSAQPEPNEAGGGSKV